MMQYTCSVAMGPVEELIEIARTAEEVGFHSIALPDSLFYMESSRRTIRTPPTGRGCGTRTPRGWTR